MMVQQVAFVVTHAIAGESNGDFLEVVMLVIEHHEDDEDKYNDKQQLEELETYHNLKSMLIQVGCHHHGRRATQ